RTMSEQYAAMARKHWTKWLPKKTAELKEAGQFEAATMTAGRQARERVDELMQQGYQLHEAEEVARSEFLLLKPEPDANEEPWERDELAQLAKRPK
ncbi:MAG: hypothetical protein IIZ92_16815, partial [Aquincola sp.]|nr:hypothetical protein [Aquincola sp.]